MGANHFLEAQHPALKQGICRCASGFSPKISVTAKAFPKPLPQFCRPKALALPNECPIAAIEIAQHPDMLSASAIFLAYPLRGRLLAFER
ncbi:MAG: hypothetical protein O3A14_08890 [Cyanobacteria bacterium]|nr:hypothetical protein [Cyanobacteriota bacterium]